MRQQTRSLLVASILALSGGWACTPEPTCTGDWCGTAVAVSGAEAATLFPPNTDSDVEFGLVDLLFVKLADLGPGLNTLGDSGFVPLLAQSWQFDDPRTIRFSLHPAARWHDGEPVTAQDVVFTFGIYRDSLVAATAGPRVSEIASVEAPDARTVIFRFHRVYPEQFYDAVYHMRILPRHVLDSIPRDRLVSHPFGRQPIGSGPYRFVRWNAGEYVELAADSNYFLGRPGVPRIIWRFAAGGPAALSQLMAGEADVLNYLGGRENVRRVSQADHLRTVEYPSLIYSYVAFNFRDPQDRDRPHPLFSDRALRRVIALAVDREAVVRAVLGDFGQVALGPLTSGFAIWSDAIPQIPFDRERARRLLGDLGWRDSDGDGTLDRAGQRLAFDLLVPSSSTPRVRSAQVIQDQLRRVGVAMSITELDFVTWKSRAEEGRHDAVFGSYGGDPSPASIGEVWTGKGIGAFNYGHYINPVFERLVGDALEAPDASAARALWHNALAELNADAPAIFVYVPATVAGIHARFEDVTIRSDQWTATLWTWRVNPAELIERDRFGVD